MAWAAHAAAPSRELNRHTHHRGTNDCEAIDAEFSGAIAACVSHHQCGIQETCISDANGYCSFVGLAYLRDIPINKRANK